MINAAFLGVDVGGSHTEVALASADGSILARAEGPGAALRAGGATASAVIIAELAREAAGGARLTLPVARAVVGAAGAGRAPERDDLAAALHSAGVAERVDVMGDGELTLAAAFDDGPGIVMSAGTGSMAYARDGAGRLHRAGGYGWQMSDEGGGYWLGRRALACLGRSQDGRDPPSTLTQRIPDGLGLKTFDDVVRWAARAAPPDIAALAPYLLEAAAAGERPAQDAVHEAAAHLAELVVALARHFPENAALPVATAGGLLASGAPLTAAVGVALARRLPRARLRSAPLDAAGTAAGLAAQRG